MVGSSGHGGRARLPNTWGVSVPVSVMKGAGGQVWEDRVSPFLPLSRHHPREQILSEPLASPSENESIEPNKVIIVPNQKD